MTNVFSCFFKSCSWYIKSGNLLFSNKTWTRRDNKKRPINKGVERSWEIDKSDAVGNKLCMLLLGVAQDSSPFENYHAKHLSDTKISFLGGINNELPEFVVVLQAKMEWQKHDPNILYLGRNPSIANSLLFQKDVKMLNINSSVNPVQYK